MNKPTGLWAHQAADLKALLDMLERFMAVLYVAPTGSGKAHVLAAVAKVWRGRVLVLTHRRIILEQLVARLIGAGIRPEDIGVIRGDDDRVNPGARIQVASVDTMSRRDDGPDADIVLIDEAHHTAAPSWTKVLSWYAKKRKLGFTATPLRLDGKPLGVDADPPGHFQVMHEGPQVNALIELGVLRRAEVWTAGEFDRKGLKKSGGDLGGELVAKRVKAIVGNLPGHYRKHASGQGAVVFAGTREHGDRIVHSFARDGVTAVEMYGDMADAERETTLAAFSKRKLKILVTCDVLSEGWHVEGASCAILAAPTASLARYRQWCGRVLHKQPGPVPKILDHAGNAKSKSEGGGGFGVPETVYPWSLDGEAKKTRDTKTVDGRVLEMTAREQREIEERNGKLKRLEYVPPTAEDVRGFCREWTKRGVDQTAVRKLAIAYYGPSVEPVLAEPSLAAE